VYDSECTYKAASRKVTQRSHGSSKEENGLQSRVESLEARLNEAAERIGRLESLSTQTRITPELLPLAGGHRENNELAEEIRSPASMELPPIQEIMPVVEKYLTTFNSFLPLFDPRTLLCFVENWYRIPHRRDSITWAAINVVLALGHRESDPEGKDLTESIAEYTHNAQSMLTEVVMGDTDLINVQVLVGLVLLFQGAQDLGPPTILIATALRLAHKLGLHTRRSYEHLNFSLALQRNRVFWLVYILDRDISMRTRQPPLQVDSDIDLDFPPNEPGNNEAGFVFAADGHSKLNFLLARVQLARIQGSVYYELYSVRAQNYSPYERAENLTHVSHMLDNWNSHVPREFSPSLLSQAIRSELSRNFAILYATHLSCRSLVRQAHSWDSQWVRSLQEYGKMAAEGLATSPVSLPEGWETLVNESREFMGLFTNVERKDTAFVQ